MSIKCIIVDDEFLARQLLEGYVKKIPYLELVGSCESAVDALRFLQQQSADLILLDVNMPDLSGIDFIRTLKNKPEVIITTAYSEHAIEGYQLDVTEYLLKPIYFDRFLQAINKVKDLLELKARALQAAKTSSGVVAELSGNSFFIKTGPQKIIKINVNDIFYIESLHEYIRIHLSNNESHTIYHSLKGVLDILPPEKFIQIHRSYIINFNQVSSLEGATVKLGSIELSVGKNFRDVLMDRIKFNSIGITTSKAGNPKGEEQKEE